MEWDTCRICLEGGDMVSLFDSDESNELLCDKYKYTTGIEVVETDSLPTLICLMCVDRLTVAYQFRQQCIASNETLKECISEFNKTNATISNNLNYADSETVTIKQENGVSLQYELPVEHVGGLSMTPKRGRGRPRKHPKQQVEIALSLYQRDTNPNVMITQSDETLLSDVLASGGVKQEQNGDGELDFLLEERTDYDPDYEPNIESDDDEPDDNEPDDDELTEEPDVIQTAPRKKKSEGSTNKQTPKKKSEGPTKKPAPKKKKTPKQKEHKPKEDILLKEAIMAYNEPLAEDLLKPKPKKRTTYIRKKKSSEITHTCETCGKSFRDKGTLQGHIRRHLGIKPFVCSVCGFAFVISLELKRHMRRHTGQKPYKCRICEREFSDFGSRQKHERIHLGERPYQCSLCGKSFTYSYSLSKHMLTHTGEKKYSCTLCKKNFTMSYHLRNHNKTHHKEIYLQQQKELEAKKKWDKCLTDVLAKDLMSGRPMQLVQTKGEGGEMQLQVVQEIEVGEGAERGYSVEED